MCTFSSNSCVAGREAVMKLACKNVVPLAAARLIFMT